jgi:hypothetical protein
MVARLKQGDAALKKLKESDVIVQNPLIRYPLDNSPSTTDTGSGRSKRLPMHARPYTSKIPEP